jgi:hypothetical protein
VGEEGKKRHSEMYGEMAGLFFYIHIGIINNGSG